MALRADSLRFDRIAVLAGVLGGCFGVGTLLVLHLLPRFGGVDPVDAMVSDYARGPVGAWFDAAILAISLTSALLAAWLHRAGLLRGVLGNGSAAVWCLALLGVATFTKDPAHVPLTAVGAVHLWVTSACCVSFPALCASVWLRFRRHPVWRGRARVLGALAVANVLCMAPFVAAFCLGSGHNRFDGLGTGLLERLMILADLAAALVLAWWARAMAYRTNCK